MNVTIIGATLGIGYETFGQALLNGWQVNTLFRTTNSG